MPSQSPLTNHHSSREGSNLQSPISNLQSQNETFAESLKMATLNLNLAYKYRTGQILFVLYADEAIRAEFEKQLMAQIVPQRVRRIRFYPDDPPEAAGLLFGRLGRNPPARDEVVFIYDVRHAFNGLFNSLNYQRELIPEGRWRLVFWTSEEEMVAIMRNAPDFWAFVHNWFELPPGAQEEQASSFTDSLAGKYLEWEDTFRDVEPEERQSRIALREKYLANLPNDERAVPYRQYLRYMVGILYLYERKFDQAMQHLQKAVELAILMEHPARQAQSLNRLGHLYHQLGRHNEAITAYQRAIALDPTYAPPHYHLAKVYRKLGRHNEAAAAYQRAIALIDEDLLPT